MQYMLVMRPWLTCRTIIHMDIPVWHRAICGLCTTAELFIQYVVILYRCNTVWLYYVKQYVLVRIQLHHIDFQNTHVVSHLCSMLLSAVCLDEERSISVVNVLNVHCIVVDISYLSASDDCIAVVCIFFLETHCRGQKINAVFTKLLCII